MGVKIIGLKYLLIKNKFIISKMGIFEMILWHPTFSCRDLEGHKNHEMCHN